MPFISVKVIENVFTPAQRQEIVRRVTDAMVEIEGEGMRPYTWCVVEEMASWGVGGQVVGVDDVKAIAAGVAV